MEETNILQCIAICISVFLVVGFIAYMFSKKIREIVDGVYQKNIHFLQNKRLSFLAKGLSHGGIHFVAFVFVLVLIFFMIKKTDGYKVNPHKVEVSFFYNHISGMPSDTTINIKKFSLKFILNSDSVYKRSNGISRNSVVVSYSSGSQDSIHCGVVRIKGNFKNDSVKVIRDTICTDSIPNNDGTKRFDPFTYKANYELTYENDSICKVTFYPAKNQSSLQGRSYGLQSVEIACDAFGNDEGNPYCYYYYKINAIRDLIDVVHDGYNVNYSIQFGDEMYSNDSFFTHSSKNLKYNYIFPEPDRVSNGIIEYSSIESCQNIMRNGSIAIQAEDIDLLNKANRDVFLYSVLAGMLTGFLLDILAQQVRELRNVNRRGEKSFKTKKNRTTKETAKEDEVEIVDQEDEGERTNSEKDDLEVVEVAIAAEPVEEKVIAKNETLKRIEVVAAIIRKGDKIFATQRGYGDFKDWWEFPGGKMEPGETPEDALKREIQEELSTEISVDEFICTVDYDYPQFHLTMHCYLCSLLSEALHLNEHEAAKWLAKDELGSVKWLPADLEVVEKLNKHI